MLRSIAGDARAHAALLTEVAAILRTHLRGKPGTAQCEVEDLVQEALIAIHLRREHYDPSRPVLPWVLAIAHYKWVDHLRREKSNVTVSIENAEEVAEVDKAEQTCASIDVQKLLTGLPQRQREAIESTKLQGLSVAEAATRFGVSQSAVKIHVHRGLKALAANIKRAVRAYG